MSFIRYWGAKPNSTVSSLISKYSQPGDVVFDPFGGRGTTVIESLRSGRRVIYNDANPLAVFIAKNLVQRTNITLLELFYTKLIKQLSSDYYSVSVGNKQLSLTEIYDTLCPCGKINAASYVVWSTAYAFQRKLHLQKIKPLSKLEQIASEILTLPLPRVLTHYKLMGLVQMKQTFAVQKKHLITMAIRKILVTRRFFSVIGERPVYISFVRACECGRTAKEVDKSDMILLNEISQISSKFPFPKDLLAYEHGQPFQKRRTALTLADLFTRRNLIVLSSLRDAILNLDAPLNVKDAFLLCLASALFASSKMQRPKGGAWPVGCYWIPPVFVEKNVLRTFESRFRRLVAWKKSVSATNGTDQLISDKANQVIEGKYNMAFLQCDARNLPLPDNSVDYVIVDPPQSDEFQYFELSFLAARWLNMEVPFEEEIVINERQGKDAEIYWRMIQEALDESIRVLKPGKCITVLLHGEEKQYFRKFKRMLRQFPLKQVQRSFNEYRFKNQLHAKDRNRLNGDFYLTFRKI